MNNKPACARGYPEWLSAGVLEAERIMREMDHEV